MRVHISRPTRLATSCLAFGVLASTVFAQDTAPIPPGVDTTEPIVGTEVEPAPIVSGVVDSGVVEGEPGLLPSVDASAAMGDAVGAPVASPQLFYNYYVWNGQGVAAPMYIAPRPVPQHVGHTYYTYQPAYPHEWMYPHYREYYNYHTLYQGGGVGYTSYNKTQVVWKRGQFHPLTGVLHANGIAPHKQYRKYGWGMPIGQ